MSYALWMLRVLELEPDEPLALALVALDKVVVQPASASKIAREALERLGASPAQLDALDKTQKAKP